MRFTSLSEVRLEFERNMLRVYVEKFEIIIDSMELFNVPNFPMNLLYIHIYSLFSAYSTLW